MSEDPGACGSAVSGGDEGKTQPYSTEPTPGGGAEKPLCVFTHEANLKAQR